jgi:hypothetical protein
MGRIREERALIDGVGSAEAQDGGGPVHVDGDSGVFAEDDGARRIRQGDVDEGEFVVRQRKLAALRHDREAARAAGGGELGSCRLDAGGEGDRGQGSGAVGRAKGRTISMRGPGGSTSEALPVEEELHLIVGAVHLDRHRHVLVTAPAPAADGVGPCPGRGDDLAVDVLRAAHGDVRRRAQTEHDLARERGGAPMTGDVDVADVGQQPRVVRVDPSVVGGGVPGAADADFAQLVPAGPGEVADHVRVVLDERPEPVDLSREGLGSDDDARSRTG